MAKVNWNECVCHGYSTSDSKLIPFSKDSWKTLCVSARRRQDHVYKKLYAYIDGSVPLPVEKTSIFRHINCFKSYILEKSLLRVEIHRKRTSVTLEDGDSSQCSPEKRLTRSKVSPTNVKECIICQE